MTSVIILFGFIVLIAGIIIIISPEIFFAYLRKNHDRRELHILAVVLRLVIGAILINQAAESRFPLAIEILGWLSIVAALTFAAIGSHNFLKLMSWVLTLLKPYGRAAGVFAAAFGGFLVYAFI